MAASKVFNQFDIGSELVIVGQNPENADYTNPRGDIIRPKYFVEVTNDHGDRLIHRWSYDTEEEAVALMYQIEQLAKRRTLNPDAWGRGRAVYGSDAYVEYGCADDLAWEANCRYEERVGLR